jgi:uncharacterized membrane protein
MAKAAHLWAIAYDDMERAERYRDELIKLAAGSGQAGRYIILSDIAVVVRHPDGTFTLDRKRFPGVANILACSAVGFLAGLVVAAPLTGATVGALIGGAGTAAAGHAGIDQEFIDDVKKLMKPGTSALFILDDAVDLDVILHKIRGLGGTVVKTNVDLERASLIQSTLASSFDRKEDL